MKWKYEAIDKLKHYEAKRCAARSLPEELRRLEGAATAIRSGTRDGTAVTGGGCGREDRLLNNITQREELKKSQTVLAQWLAPVERAMAVLTEEERLVLDSFYIHPSKGCVAQLCEKLGCEKSTVYNRRDAALYRFTIALYGCVET